MLAAKPSRLRPDVQHVFALLPPEKPLGEALFRLAEAYPRTPDEAGRRALVDEFLHRAMPLLPVDFATRLIARQFVYAETMAGALLRAARNRRNRFSFDMLGEGARTADDAERNFGRYRDAVRAAAAEPARYGVSIKLSSIHPRYDAAGFQRSRAQILERVAALCGRGVLVTIDAEEAERLSLQLAILEDLPDWNGVGLAVQAYRPGVLDTLARVIEMARRRGERLHVRLVKGAYWDAEVKRAQELGVQDYPVFTDKRATDLAYVRAAALLLDHAAVVFPQFATHNPVSAACVLALAESRAGAFEFQRLHGMGAPLDAALARHFPEIGVRVYAPVGGRRDLLAYLVRRLLENGASTSFVRQAAASSDVDALLAQGFEFLSPADDRSLPLPTEIHMLERGIARGYDLGDPEALAAMAESAASHKRQWKAAPLVAGRTLGGSTRSAVSPARPDVALGEITDAAPDAVREAMDAACKARSAWARTPVEERARCLERLADLLEANLHELIALCVWEAGKTLPDALADVREAVDFCRYYAAQARRLFAPLELKSPAGESNVLTLHARGVFACISPWNFPVAIYTGQVAAALVAGNTVVAKPAEQSPLAAYRVAQLILEAGVPPDAFHLLPGDGSVGAALVEDPRIAGVVFTGSTATARAIQASLAKKDGPIVPLIAETGGLNAMLVDSTALPEQVCDAVVSSAFRSAGQRCSSLRMLYLQDEVADAVLGLLKGAIEALRVGDPADPSTDVGPVIDADAQSHLQGYVDGLRERRRLIAQAGPLPASGHYLAPVAFEVDSIRDLPGERFGPILHVARFAIEDLDRVVDDINAMGYGLTMGVHTRIDSRAERIRSRAAVGNLYVNRNIIGAMVGVQPFGGEGLSGTGPKAGGPHYLARFATERVYTVNTAAAGGDLRLLTRAASGMISAALTDEIVLETRGLTKEFKGFIAVKDVSLKVRRGSIHALIGPNGAGKTTCFNLLTHFLEPTRGQIFFKGTEITGSPPARIARMGLVRSFQISAVFPHLSVLENVRVALQRKRGASFDFWRSERVLGQLDGAARELIAAVNLSELENAVAGELPYGRKRALEIATTLALDPEMMLLDEPTAGMTHEDVERTAALIRRVSANRTVLMVEHNLSVVSTLSDTITVLARGEVLAEGDYAKVSGDPRVVEAYLGAGHA